MKGSRVQEEIEFIEPLKSWENKENKARIRFGEFQDSIPEKRSKLTCKNVLRAGLHPRELNYAAWNWHQSTMLEMAIRA